jgi:hypothetical protein
MLPCMSLAPLPTPLERKRTKEDVKFVLAAAINNLAPEIERWIHEVAVDSPARAADLALRLAEHFVPKLSRQEVTGDGGGPIRVVVHKLSLVPGPPEPRVIDVTPTSTPAPPPALRPDPTKDYPVSIPRSLQDSPMLVAVDDLLDTGDEQEADFYGTPDF